MVASRALIERITADAKAGDFWSVPKGQAVHASNWPRIADHLRILAEFETVPWEEAQPRFAAVLRARRLIRPYRSQRAGFSAVARMQFPVWRLLGLAWINPKNEPEVTDVGKAFVAAASETERRDLLATQLHRYQFYNPAVAPHFRRFRTFPVLALYRLLSLTDWALDRDELLLFATRVRSFADADDLGQLIEEWRTLAPTEQQRLLATARTIRTNERTKSQDGTTLGKVERDLPYLRALVGILPGVEPAGAGLAIAARARRSVLRLTLAAAETAEVVDYATEQDWLASYGQRVTQARSRSPWTTAVEARAYYERIGRIDAATDAFARESGTKQNLEIERYRSIQIRERVLEDILEHNLGELEPGLTLEGRQFPTAVGPIDLLARDPQGRYVVIELKRGRGSDRVIGQIARYLSWVAARLAGGRESQVRGIVVGSEFNRQFDSAVSQLRRVCAYTFDLQVRFDAWPSQTARRLPRR